MDTAPKKYKPLSDEAFAKLSTEEKLLYLKTAIEAQRVGPARNPPTDKPDDSGRPIRGRR